jgi:hypothetical protein
MWKELSEYWKMKIKEYSNNKNNNNVALSTIPPAAPAASGTSASPALDEENPQPTDRKKKIR